jgi:hypothetical protein
LVLFIVIAKLNANNIYYWHNIHHKTLITADPPRVLWPETRLSPAYLS